MAFQPDITASEHRLHEFHNDISTTIFHSERTLVMRRNDSDMHKLYTEKRFGHAQSEGTIYHRAQISRVYSSYHRANNTLYVSFNIEATVYNDRALR